MTSRPLVVIRTAESVYPSKRQALSSDELIALDASRQELLARAVENNNE